MLCHHDVNIVMAAGLGLEPRQTDSESKNNWMFMRNKGVFYV